MGRDLVIWELTHEFEPYIIGGLGTAVTQLTRSLVQNGAQAVVISKTNRQTIEYSTQQGIAMIRFPKTTTYFHSTRQQFKPNVIDAWLQRRAMPKPTVIHIHSPQYILLANHFRKKYNVKIIYTCHSLIALEEGSDQNKQMVEQQQKQLFYVASKVVVPSKWQANLIKMLYPNVSTKVVVIPHGVTKRKQITPGDRHKLLFVGRIIPVKGLDHLFEGISILKRAGHRVFLDIIGTGSKDYVHYLRNYAKLLGIDANIRWRGFIPQQRLQQMYSSYGAIVMPSHHESFGLVALEALASGLPLIATTAGGLS